MKKTAITTKVKFYNELGGILAVFPEMIHSSNGYRNDNLTCYSHVGQHSAAAPEYISKLKEATPFEYNSLLVELVSLGYELEVLNSPEPSPIGKEVENEVFTPGKWRVEIHTPPSNCTMYLIANTMGAEYGEEAEANRKLIQQAPTLYRDNARLLQENKELKEAIAGWEELLLKGDPGSLSGYWFNTCKPLLNRI